MTADCPLCGGKGRIKECRQSCDGTHREDLTWTCHCVGDRSPSDVAGSAPYPGDEPCACGAVTLTGYYLSERMERGDEDEVHYRRSAGEPCLIPGREAARAVIAGYTPEELAEAGIV